MAAGTSLAPTELNGPIASGRFATDLKTPRGQRRVKFMGKVLGSKATDRSAAATPREGTRSGGGGGYPLGWGLGATESMGNGTSHGGSPLGFDGATTRY